MRRLLALCLLALALPVAAQAAPNPIVAAAKRSASATSSTFAVTSTTALAGKVATTVTGSGTQRGKAARISMKTRVAGKTLAFDAVVLHERGAYLMYLRSPALQAQLPPGKTWWRVDLSKGMAALGIDFTSLMDTSQNLALLEHGIVETKRLGNETAAGRPTIHYRGVLDVRRAARALPAYGEQIAAFERATGIRLTRSTYHVWIGRDGRIRRMQVTTPAVFGGTHGTSVQTMTFLSYGVPGRIAPPPAAQVAVG